MNNSEQANRNVTWAAKSNVCDAFSATWSSYTTHCGYSYFVCLSFEDIPYLGPVAGCYNVDVASTAKHLFLFCAERRAGP